MTRSHSTNFTYLDTTDASVYTLILCAYLGVPRWLLTRYDRLREMNVLMCFRIGIVGIRIGRYSASVISVRKVLETKIMSN